jgi:hypothetical protein
VLSGPQQVHPKLLLTDPLYSCPVLEGTRTVWTSTSSSQAAAIRFCLLLFLKRPLLPGPYQYHSQAAAVRSSLLQVLRGPCCIDPSSSSQAAANRSSLLLWVEGSLADWTSTSSSPSCCYQVLFTPVFEGSRAAYRPHQVHPKLLLTVPLFSCSLGEPCCLDPTKFFPSCCYQVLFTPVLEGSRAAWTPSSSSQAAAIGSSFLLFLREAVLPGPHQVHPKLLLSGPLYSCY